MADPALLEDLERLLRRQDEYTDDTFEILDAAYAVSVRDVADEVRGIVDEIDTDNAGRFDDDVMRTAQARLVALESAGAVVTVWERWSERLDRLQEFTQEYFERGGAGPSAVESALVEELKGLWPTDGTPTGGAAGQFYQLSVHHRQKLANSVTRHVLGRARKEQLVAELAEEVDRSTAQASQLFKDSTIQFSRTVQANRADDQGFEYFKYFGPLDSITRPFCAPLVGQIFTREEIDAMDNGQTGTGSVMVAGGGYGCRHVWQPVRRSWFTDEDWEAQRSVA